MDVRIMFRANNKNTKNSRNKGTNGRLLIAIKG